MSKLTWLHLSDIHFLPSNEWRDSTARSDLLEYLEKQLAEHQIQVDLVFCTGDIAFGKLPAQTLDAQYAMAGQFFDDVLKVCKCDKSRLFVVPGNHDIDRGCITNAVKLAWQGWGDDKKSYTMVDEIPGWFATLNPDAKDALRRLDAYARFATDYLPHQKNAATGHCHHAQILDINGIKVGIAGFNSAWTCAGDEDDRRLWLAASPQFDFMRQSVKTADVKIGLIHHPLDWFNVAERSIIKQRIADETDFWLHGHTHDTWVEPLPTHVTLGAGAVTAYAEGEFGCNLVQLDLASKKGQARLYRYQKKKARWIRATDITPDDDGVWRFDIPKAVKVPVVNVAASVGSGVADTPGADNADPASNAMGTDQPSGEAALKLEQAFYGALQENLAQAFKARLCSELALPANADGQQILAKLDALPTLQKQLFRVQKVLQGQAAVPLAHGEPHPVERAAVALYMRAALRFVNLQAAAVLRTKATGLTLVPEKSEVVIAILMAALEGEIHALVLKGGNDPAGMQQAGAECMIDLDEFPHDPLQDDLALDFEAAKRVNKAFLPEQMAGKLLTPAQRKYFCDQIRTDVAQQRELFNKCFRFIVSSHKSALLQDDGNCGALFRRLGIPVTRVGLDSPLAVEALLCVSTGSIDAMFRQLLVILNQARQGSSPATPVNN